MMNDKYQKSYLEHQENKLKRIGNNGPIKYNLEEQEVLFEIMRNRRSQRIFNNKVITEDEFNLLYNGLELAPSSCNRQAIEIEEISVEDGEKFLVGATNWGNNASMCLLLFANNQAYKSPNEKGFMPYLDAGFVAQNIYLLSEVLGIGCCFVNPNLRKENKEEFEKYYKLDNYFCGAIFLGHYDKKAKTPPKRKRYND